VLPGDWRELYRAAPFDLLMLDGGELRLAPDLAALVATRRFPAS
jgi:hypothetical protein